MVEVGLEPASDAFFRIRVWSGYLQTEKEAARGNGQEAWSSSDSKSFVHWIEMGILQCMITSMSALCHEARGASRPSTDSSEENIEIGIPVKHSLAVYKGH